MITVIVPIYNAATTLRRCVDSILRQTYRDFELLLINDGSTDASPQICDEYARQDSRVRVFHKENGGVSSARNVGLDNARGEWITFCDADDWVFPCWLQNYMGHGDAFDLIVQGFEVSCTNKDANGKMCYGVEFNGDIKEGLLELYRDGSCGICVVKLFRATVIRKHNLCFDSGIRLREDEDFILSYAKYCNMMLSVSYCGYYYNRPNYEVKYRSEYFPNKEFDLMEGLLCKTLVFYEEYNEHVEYYVNAYTNALLAMYKAKHKERRNHLRRYKTIAGKLLLQSRQYPMMQWLIYVDSSFLFSSLFLDVCVLVRYGVKRVCGRSFFLCA